MADKDIYNELSIYYHWFRTRYDLQFSFPFSIIYDIMKALFSHTHKRQP